MTTPSASSSSIDTGNLSGAKPAGQAGGDGSGQLRRDELPWLNPAFYAIGAIAGVGFLVAMFGIYIIPNLVAIFAGTIIVVLSVIAWIIVALLMIAAMLKQLFSPRGRTDGARQPKQ